MRPKKANSAGNPAFVNHWQCACLKSDKTRCNQDIGARKIQSGEFGASSAGGTLSLGTIEVFPDPLDIELPLNLFSIPSISQSIFSLAAASRQWKASHHSPHNEMVCTKRVVLLSYRSHALHADLPMTSNN